MESRPLDQPLSEQDVLAAHRQILADIDDRSAGRFRTGRVLIAGSRHVPPGAQKFPELIPGLLELARRPGMHTALQAAELHYNFVAVHPLDDGSGRTARLLMNHHLLRHGYPPGIIEVAHRGAYLSALDQANEGRCEGFARGVIDGIALAAMRLLGG